MRNHSLTPSHNQQARFGHLLVVALIAEIVESAVLLALAAAVAAALAVAETLALAQTEVR